jgi:hypothetical protein
MVGVIRIELMTSSMSTKRSTTELHAQIHLKKFNILTLVQFALKI